MLAPAIHHRAAILAVGDELILGQTIDTNSKWLSVRLTELGIHVVEHATVPDDVEAQTAALRRLAATAPLVIVTGGLGPTLDDLTRAALARAMNEQLVEDPALLLQIEEYFKSVRARMPSSNRLQAQRPASGEGLPNRNGTAPGLYAVVRTDATNNARASDVYCLPGPPGEMRPMFDDLVAPRLRPPAGRIVRTLALHTFGLGESVIAERLGALMDRARNPLVGTTASGGIVTCRIRYEGPESGAEDAMRETERAVRAALKQFILASGDDSLAQSVLHELQRKGESLVVVESCTGGMLGSMITDVPGSSRCFLGGWITYSNEFKSSQVSVSEPLLRAPGAVSAQVARAMASGALATPAGAGATHALAITGVAGPDGGTQAKPVGTVFIARASRLPDGQLECDVRHFAFSGDRTAIRRRSAVTALAMLRFSVIGETTPPLPRQQP